MVFTIIVIIAIIAAVLLGLVVLVQNPKGGGLSGSFGGAANQIFGYKRTTDDIEKITWGLVIVVFALCLSAAAMKPTESAQSSNGYVPEASRKNAVTNTLPTATDEGQDPTTGTDGATDGGTTDGGDGK